MADAPGGAGLLIHKLARPSRARTFRTPWLAMGGLALFLLLYFALAGWFRLDGWRPHLPVPAKARARVLGLDGRYACAAFLAVFMLRRCSSSHGGGDDDDMAITPEQQPELFRFLQLPRRQGRRAALRTRCSSRRASTAAVFTTRPSLNLVLPRRRTRDRPGPGQPR